MSPGSSGAKYLRSRVNRPDQRPAGPTRSPEKPDREEERQIPAERATPTTNSTGSSNILDEYFQMAMNRFLKEQILVTVQSPPLGRQDIDMDTILTISGFRAPPVILPAELRSLRVIADPKGPNFDHLGPEIFTGKDVDEDRARAWIGNVKSAFQRDQATDKEECLTFADPLVGPGKNWHRQLSRTTKTKWSDLLDSFQTQYCGLAALRAKLKIKDGNPKARREHVDHYIETLGDPELADRLTLLRLADVAGGSSPCAGTSQEQATPICVRIEISTEGPSQCSGCVSPCHGTHDPDAGSELRGSQDRTDQTRKVELRRTFLAAAEEKLIGTGKTRIQHDPERKRQREAGTPNVPPRETRITKSEITFLIVGPGNTRIWILRSV
ncbi:LOW QUALITY PROTEIN: hypothetical protein PHMEG_00019102 [Phytophthora megakarya]|uniref:Retrotransposon gag domain-containing protein n=1 Tax=Phytophthora megakarya TaxID=4795 RepID=A0A225VSE2_9STRA|nr:LOW QUALITY PROTEIN: hypothetical protein PHMEG_00019102 [Phytophthora megakarya]